MTYYWTDSSKDKAKALWLGGYSASQIAQMLGGGVSRNAVIGVMHRAGLMGQKRASTALRAASAPRAIAAAAEPVAKAVGAPRMGHGGYAKVRTELRVPPPSPKQGKPARRAGLAVVGGTDRTAPPEPLEIVKIVRTRPEPITDDADVVTDAAASAQVGTEGKTLLSLKSCDCRWPVGPSPRGEMHLQRFCGELAVEGKPYCEDHARSAYVKTPAPRGLGLLPQLRGERAKASLNRSHRGMGA